MNENTAAKLKTICAMLIFGTLGVFAKFIPMPASAIALSRGFLGMLFLLFTLLVRRKRLSFSALKKNALLLVISGTLLGMNWMLLFEAYNYTTVATATLCYYLAPVFLTLASPLFFKEKLTAKKLVCIAAALLGMVCVSGVLEAEVKATELTGIIMGIAAAAIYAAIVILNKHLRDISDNDRTTAQLAVSAVVMLPYVLLTEDVSSFTFTPISVVLLIVLGVVHTGLAYYLYFGSIGRLPSQTIAIFSYIDPVVAVLLSALFLKEPMGIWGIVGAVLILGSTLISELDFKMIKEKLRHKS